MSVNDTRIVAGEAGPVLNGWKLMPPKATGNMLDAMLEPWLNAGHHSERQKLEAGYAGLLGAAPPAPVEAGARPFLLTLAAGLNRGDDPAMLMDENSPLRDELRRLLATPATKWCDWCGCGSDRYGFAHLPGCIAAPSDAPAQQGPLTAEDVERQYDNGVHIGSGLPRATCPCGFCERHRHGFNQSKPAQQEPEWIDDPHDIEQGMMRNPKYVAPAAQGDERAADIQAIDEAIDHYGAACVYQGMYGCGGEQIGDELRAMNEARRRKSAAIALVCKALSRQPSAAAIVYRDCHSKIIKSLAAIARTGGPDTRNEYDPELIYRSPVMDEIGRIRDALDKCSAALAAAKPEGGE